MRTVCAESFELGENVVNTGRLEMLCVVKFVAAYSKFHRFLM